MDDDRIGIARGGEGAEAVSRLDSKVALITGGASGLGRAIAMRFAAEGAQVVMTDLPGSAGASAAAQCRCAFLEQDVTSEEHWQRVMDQIRDRFGKLHVLVNNAGIVGSLDRSTPENITLDTWRAVQRVNVEGTLLGCRSVIPLMRASGGGSIINMSSIAALLPGPETAAYAASKAAVRNLTTSVAIHGAKDGSKIRCNSIHPGTCLTDMVRSAAEALAKIRGNTAREVLEEMRSQIPIGEFIEPEDVANAAVFLASDESKRVTGTALFVDGGETCA
jgi:3(or 17)beta-hydroxysteroid dehydrogenase